MQANQARLTGAAIILAAMLLAWPAPGQAQDANPEAAPDEMAPLQAPAPGPAPTPHAALRRVATACVHDVERFCPALADTAATPRNQVICLRPYRFDLSLGCRGAVAGASSAP